MIGCLFCKSLPLFPPSMVFSTLSFCPACWLHVFFGVWSWSSAGFVEQLKWTCFGVSVFICLCAGCVCSVSVCAHTISTLPLFPLQCFCLYRLSPSRHHFSIPVSVCSLFTRFLQDIHSRELSEGTQEQLLFVQHFLFLFSPHPSAFYHSSLVWKQERAVFKQYYSCPLWLWSRVGHQSVPPSGERNPTSVL